MQRVETTTTTTPFTAAVAAFRIAETKLRQVSDAHDAAEEAESFARAAFAEPSLPTELNIRVPGCRMIGESGKEVVVEATTCQLRTEEQILQHHTGDRAAASTMLSALQHWDGERDKAAEACGYASLARAEHEAARAFTTTYNELIEAGLAILRIPTRDPVEGAIKREIVDTHFDCEEDIEKALNALLDAAIAPLSSPPAGSDASLIAASDHFHRLEGALSTISDTAPYDSRAAEAATAEMQVPIDIALARRATTVAGLQAKAKIAQYWQPNEDCDEYDDLPWMVHRSLVDDILALQVEEDAELIALGAELERRWAAEHALELRGSTTDQELDEVCDHTGEIIDKIHGIKPLTAAGWRVRARAVAWHESAYDTPFGTPVEPGHTPDQHQAAAMLINDLIAAEHRPQPRDAVYRDELKASWIVDRDELLQRGLLHRDAAQAAAAAAHHTA